MVFSASRVRDECSANSLRREQHLPGVVPVMNHERIRIRIDVDIALFAHPRPDLIEYGADRIQVFGDASSPV